MTETNTMDVIFVDYLLPGEPEGTTPHHVTLKEFLALPQDQLTEQNQKIQKALGQLYKLNDREPPLFNSFPKREAGPLVIDCTPIVRKNIGACYDIEKNKVMIEESEFDSTEVSLLGTFAHELKHAEQTSEECYKLQMETLDNDGSAYHQLRYLKEAQAYLFGKYVKFLFLMGDKDDSFFHDAESAMMKEELQHLYKEGYYKNIYDLCSPITRKDKGLTAEDIPVSFHFRDKQEALSWLEGMPRYAHTWEGRRKQLQKEHKYVFRSMQLGYTEGLKYFVYDGLTSGEMPPRELLIMIEMAFTDEQPSAQHMQASEEMLNYFLDLQVDGKPLMSGEFMAELLDGARASGRKDVEEVIWKPCMQYQADLLHQGLKDDPELVKDTFVKEFVKSNLNDKSSSSDDLLEIVAKEFTRPAEEYISDEHIQNGKDVLKFLLDLQVDGKSLMQEKDITKLFKNARISGRKDVEEAMLEYKAEHPDDKRFSKEMFNSSSMDKVKEFKERQEMKAAEVEAAAKNAAKKAANKGVSALTATIKAAKSK